MDIRRPTKSEFQEIIRSFSSSDGRPEDNIEDEPRSVSPMEIPDKQDDDEADEMYIICYYGNEDKEGGEGKPKEAGETSNNGNHDEEVDEDDKEEPETSTSRAQTQQRTPIMTLESGVTDEELISKEIEDDRNMLEEQLRSIPEPEEIAKGIKETEADERELMNVEKRIKEMETENKELFKARGGDEESESLRERMRMAREIRDLRNEVAQLRISISARDDNPSEEILGETESEEGDDFCITVGIFVKLLLEDEEFENYFLSLKQQVVMANDIIVDLMGAQFPSGRIERQSESMMERRLGRALMDKVEYREILEQFAGNTIDLNELKSNYDSQEMIGDIHGDPNNYFLVTVGRFVKWLLENDEFKQYYYSCRTGQAAGDPGGIEISEEAGYSRGAEEHSDLWLEHKIGTRLVEMAELEEIMDGFKTHPEEFKSTEAIATESLSNDQYIALAEKYREIEHEIEEKLESNSNVSNKEKYLMLRKRIRELKGPVSQLGRVETLESVNETESETESADEGIIEEDLVAYLSDELKGENVELWQMVEERLNAIEKDKARMMEGKLELDESMGRLLQLQQNIEERSDPGWTEEMITEMKAVKSKIKQIEKEKYKLTEEYMKIDAEKVTLEAVIDRIKKKEQVIGQLMEVSKSITKVQSIVQSVRKDSRVDTKQIQENAPPKKKVSLKLVELSKSMKNLQEALVRRKDTGHRDENDEVIQQLNELSKNINKVQELMEKVKKRTPSVNTDEEKETVKSGPKHDSSTSYTPVFISIAAATALALVGILHSR